MWCVQRHRLLLLLLVAVAAVLAHAQPSQTPLPASAPSSTEQPNWEAVRTSILAAMRDRRRGVSSLLADTHRGRPHFGAQFATLAYNCAATFRVGDLQGGCNGGRVRIVPQKYWPGNHGLVDAAMERLQDVKDAFTSLSWADLIVYAGTVALEEAAGVRAAGDSPFSFCPGRVDADDAAGTEHLAPRSYASADIAFKANAMLHGLTAREAVALAARPRSAALQQFMGFSGSWAFDATRLTNDYFKLLLGATWFKTGTMGRLEYRATVESAAEALGLAPIDINKDWQSQYVYMTPEDLVIKHDPQLAAIAREYAQDNRLFVAEFARAFVKLMNADRFRGPLGASECVPPSAVTTMPSLVG